MASMIHLIAAARPNFMKVAPLYHALKAAPDFDVKVIHTGQHYDANMSDAFFEDLGLPRPDYHLEVGSGSHAQQTGNVMIKYEEVAIAERLTGLLWSGTLIRLPRSLWSVPSCIFR
jgi:UDP-N-acetylglucosamine 2-epimerase (non-hydrolysing)